MIDLDYWKNMAGSTVEDIKDDYDKYIIKSAHLQQLAVIGFHDASMGLCESPASISGVQLGIKFDTETGEVFMVALNSRGDLIEITRSSAPPIIQLIQLMPYISPEYSDKLLEWSCMIDGSKSSIVKDHPAFQRMAMGWLPHHE